MHTGSTWGNTFLAYTALFHIWRITWTNESTLGHPDFCPFASKGVIRLWLACHGFLVWQLKAKRAGPQLMCITMHSHCIIFFFFFDVCHNLPTHGFRLKKSCSVACGAETRWLCANPFITASAWRCKVSADWLAWCQYTMTGWDSNFDLHPLSVWQHTHLCAHDPSLRYTCMLLGRSGINKQLGRSEDRRRCLHAQKQLASSVPPGCSRTCPYVVLVWTNMSCWSHHIVHSATKVFGVCMHCMGTFQTSQFWTCLLHM